MPHRQSLPPPPEPILSVAEMRAAEAALMAGGITVHQLMERAGRGAADWVWRVAAGRKVTVFCGPGNNGGDGYVIAQALLERGGEAVVVAGSEPATEACKAARARFRGDVLPMGSKTPRGVLVDCLFGSGLTRPLSAAHLRELSRLHERNIIAISVDLPSGIDADSGAVLNENLPKYRLCLALGAWKYAHFLMPAASYAETARLIDLGIESDLFRGKKGVKSEFFAPNHADHKYARGYVAVIGGKMGGAAMLSARAAMRRSGYVALVGGKSRGPDALVHRRWEDIAADSRLGALLIGPGLGRDDAARETLQRAFASPHRLVLDADALMLTSPAAIAALDRPVILTPHEGEFAKLFGALPDVIAGNKIDRARAAAAASNAVVILKGADSVIAAPDGRFCLFHPAPGWLASAGTGDVLAGLCAGALSGGGDPFEAACDALWLHGEAARRAGPALIADDLIAHIPSAMAAAR